MTDPPTPPRVPPEAPVRIRCRGRVHRWAPKFEFGDTCACGAFYLFRDAETEGFSIEASERDLDD